MILDKKVSTDYKCLLCIQKTNFLNSILKIINEMVSEKTLFSIRKYAKPVTLTK